VSSFIRVAEVTIDGETYQRSALVETELPIRTWSVNGSRGHWSRFHKRAKEQRTATHAAVRSLILGALIRPRLPVVVTLTRLAPRALDDDNLRGSLKALRDGVADAMGVNDNDPAVTWEYGQDRRSKSYAVRVRIEEREP
jgi:hypothetical protein